MNNIHHQLPRLAIHFLLLSGIILIQSACTLFYNPEQYLRDYDRFVSRVENNYQEYSETQWEKTEAKYEEFNSTLYDRVYKDLTPKDQQAIGKLKARFEAVKLKYKFNHLKQEVKDGIEQFKGALESDSVD